MVWVHDDGVNALVNERYGWYRTNSNTICFPVLPPPLLPLVTSPLPIVDNDNDNEGFVEIDDFVGGIFCGVGRADEGRDVVVVWVGWIEGREGGVNRVDSYPTCC